VNPIVLSNAVNFVGVALALWLGFFNLTRSPQRTLARVGAPSKAAGLSEKEFVGGGEDAMEAGL
jgi:hypothetical protein